MKSFFSSLMPSLGPFQTLVERPAALIIGVIWFALLLVVFVHLLNSVREWSQAKRSRRPEVMEEAFGQSLMAAVSLAVLVAAPVIASVFLDWQTW